MKYADITAIIFIFIALFTCAPIKQTHIVSDITYHYIYIAQTDLTDETVTELKSTEPQPIYTQHGGRNFRVAKTESAWWSDMPMNEIIIIVHLEEL